MSELRFDGFVCDTDKKAYFSPKKRSRIVEGVVVEHHGFGTHTERGSGILLTLPPTDLEELRQDASLGKYQFVTRSSKRRLVNAPLAEGAYAEIVKGFAGDEPILGGRLKTGEFSTRNRRLSSIADKITRIIEI